MSVIALIDINELITVDVDASGDREGPQRAQEYGELGAGQCPH
ncbi:MULTISPECIES: hypothetical protein [unclassified Cryobacterium]|nr:MULTISPECIES: hypothetical protein [unclassified Cryobacterium]